MGASGESGGGRPVRVNLASKREQAAQCSTACQLGCGTLTQRAELGKLRSKRWLHERHVGCTHRPTQMAPEQLPRVHKMQCLMMAIFSVGCLYPKLKCKLEWEQSNSFCPQTRSMNRHTHNLYTGMMPCARRSASIT